jgi:hypothetical protein
MDPDRLLADIIEHAWKYESAIRMGHFDPAMEHAKELAEGIKALDNWLKGGGYLPLRWRRHGDVLNVKRLQ